MPKEPSAFPEAKEIVGKETTFTAPDPVGQAFIRQFALSVGDMNPHYVDQSFAEKSKYGGIIAPPTMVCETMYYHDGSVDEAGGPANRFTLVSMGTEIRGGNDYTFHQPMRPDDVLTARWKAKEVYEKQGRTGRLLFLVYEIRYTNQRGELLATNDEHIVYQLKQG